jgi:hypothetical protein
MTEEGSPENFGQGPPSYWEVAADYREVISYNKKVETQAK